MNKSCKGILYERQKMVPVVDMNKVSLMPCSEKKARLRMERGQAKAYWQDGVFGIMLLREPSARNYQEVVLGIDPGSKREGYTVLTKKSVVLNITTNTPDWVKKHVETRRMLRRSRRSRKTPYRACRQNRGTLRSTNRIPPSTKARWGAKLRIVKQLLKILPLTHINVEDIKAKSIKGKRDHNVSFSSLEVGKTWFYDELQKLGPILSKTEGYQTKEHRDKRGFEKSKDKLSYVWEAHNVDSHALAEMALKKEVNPFRSMYRIDFLEYWRRQLHVQNFAKGGVRKQYGSTVSLGLSRGSVVRWKGKLVYLGGSSFRCKDIRMSVHSIATGKRLSQDVDKKNIKVIHITKQRTQFITAYDKSACTKHS
jgi:RRXRR protein